MYYDKRIRYLSYYESGIKLQNAGYVKFQVRDSLCQMIIYVKGPRLMGSGETSVYLLSGRQKETSTDSFYTGSRDSRPQKHLLGNLSIRSGQGHCAVRMDAENMADTGLRYDEICGIRIELHEYQYLEASWTVMHFMPERQKLQSNESTSMGYKLREEQQDVLLNTECEEAEETPVEVSLFVTPVSENAWVEKLSQPKAISENSPDNVSDDQDSMQGMMEREIQRGTGAESAHSTQQAAQIIEMVHPANTEQPHEERTTRKAETMPTGETLPSKKSEDAGQPTEPEEYQIPEEEIMESIKGEEWGAEKKEAQLSAELQSDKWEQLKKTYPIVHPIREEEEYLKISPKDFAIFNEKYQELVHNSFLLHGYYNYKHLILGKKERDSKAVYYLGVPGTFHDREKSVAVMFGFEAFDGKREPAEKGDFGYYLKRVEI